MATTIRRVVRADPARVWRTFTDFGGYGRVIPLTRMSHDAGPPRVGWLFTGHTTLGPIRLDDPMRLTEFAPRGPDGGLFAVQKEGGVLGGWARVEVRPGSEPGTSVVIWTEEIRPVRGRRLAPLVGPPADLATRVLFSRAVAGLSALAESGDAPPSTPSGR